MRLLLLSLAETDLLAGFRFYERQSPEVAPISSIRFIRTSSRFGSMPAFTGRVLGYHRLLSKRFPFGVYYDMDEEEIRLWRVLDRRRDPQWIRSELKKDRTRRPTERG